MVTRVIKVGKEHVDFSAVRRGGEIAAMKFFHREQQ